MAQIDPAPRRGFQQLKELQTETAAHHRTTDEFAEHRAQLSIVGAYGRKAKPAFGPIASAAFALTTLPNSHFRLTAVSCLHRLPGGKMSTFDAPFPF